MSKLTVIPLIFALFLYPFNLLFFWLYETTDSFFYFAFAQFIKTGIYDVPYYNWTNPSTLGPPLYSFFLYLVQFFPRSDVIIHFFQLSSVLISVVLLHRILKSFTSRNMSLLISSLYLLIPAHFFESSTVMTESFALLSVSAYIFFAFKVILQNQKNLQKYWLLYSSVIVLIRYNFTSLFLISAAVVFFENLGRIKKTSGHNKHKDKTKSLIFANLLFIILSFAVISGWVLTNYRLNGTWGLSDQMGKNLYNRVVGGDRLVPPAADQNWLKLKALTQDKVDLFRPTYDIEPSILTYFNGNVARESQFFASIAFSAIKNHPSEYLKNTLNNFFIIHGNGLPYAHDLYTDSRWMGVNCRTLGTIPFCQPVLKTDWASSIWNFTAYWSQKYYYTLPVFFNFLLLFPALIFALLGGNKFIRFLACTYIISAFTVILPEVPVYRYLYPLYPIKAILITYFLITLIKSRRTLLLLPSKKK